MEIKTIPSEEEQYQFDEFHLMLARNFAESSAGKHNDIISALDAGNVALAHRLAHNLKSNAGQLRRSGLQKAAGAVEDNLDKGENRVTAQQLKNLETELKAAIEVFKAL